MKLMIGVKSGDLPGKYIFKSEGRAKGERVHRVYGKHCSFDFYSVVFLSSSTPPSFKRVSLCLLRSFLL